VVAFCAIKLSILLLFLRIFGLTHQKTRIAVWVLIVIVASIGISGFFGFLFLCSPVKKLFVFNTPGQCNFPAITKLSRAQSVMHVVTDLLITIVPIPMVVRLNLPTPQRLGVLAVMTTGLIVTILSIIRLTYLYPKKMPKQGASVSTQFPFTFWAVLELNIALICTSAPALKQFVGGTFPAVRRYASGLTHRVTGGSSGQHTHQAQTRKASPISSKLSWSKKSSGSPSSSEKGHNDGISQENPVPMDRRFKDGSFLELGAAKEEGVDADAAEAGFGPTTHVSAGDREMHSTSSREPIIPH
jgi:hypothetical protein